MNLNLFIPSVFFIYGLIFAIIFIILLKIIPEQYFQIKTYDLNHDYIILSTGEKIILIPFVIMNILLTSAWIWFLIITFTDFLSKINS